MLLLLWGYFVITTLGSNFTLDLEDGASFSEFFLGLAFLGFIFDCYALLSYNAKLWILIDQPVITAVKHKKEI